jgi:hypothetical protein
MIPPDLATDLVHERLRIRKVDACWRKRGHKVCDGGWGIWHGRIERYLFRVVPVTTWDAVPLEEADIETGFCQFAVCDHATWSSTDDGDPLYGPVELILVYLGFSRRWCEERLLDASG